MSAPFALLVAVIVGQTVPSPAPEAPVPAAALPEGPKPEAVVETDIPTMVAVGATAYLGAALLHEGLGHLGGCAIGGGTPLGFSVAVAGCTETSPAGHRWESAGGALANLAAGGSFAASLLLAPPKTGPEYFFLWLSAVVNLYQAAGYLMAGPWIPVGDWGSAGFLRDVSPRLPAQIGLSVLGLGLTAGTVFLGNHLAGPLLGGEPGTRRSRQWTTTLLPYLVGSTLITGSALLTRAGPEFAVTAAISTFVGTLFLAYVPLFFSDDFFYPAESARSGTALSIPRSTAWLVVGSVAVLASIFVFGPGLGAGFQRPHPFDPFARP